MDSVDDCLWPRETLRISKKKPLDHFLARTDPSRDPLLPAGDIGTTSGFSTVDALSFEPFLLSRAESLEWTERLLSLDPALGTVLPSECSLLEDAA